MVLEPGILDTLSCVNVYIHIKFVLFNLDASYGVLNTSSFCLVHPNAHKEFLWDLHSNGQAGIDAM